MLGVLNENQVYNILTTQVIGRLGCTDGKIPYIVPVTFAYDGEYIYGQSNEGEKLKLLRKNPNVCFEVELMSDMRNWQCVVLQGKFEELKNRKADKAREILFQRIFPLMTSSTVHKHEHGNEAIPDDDNRVKTIMYRIRIKKITGRFERA